MLKKEEIVSIEEIDNQEGEYVYDAEVEDTHTFFGNDILLHNSIYVEFGRISYPYEGLQIICLRAMCIIMYVEKNYKHLILISPTLMKHYAYNFIDEMNVKFYLYWDNDEMTILMSKDRVLKCFNENLDIINFDRSIEAEQYYISDYNTFIVPYFDKHHITETIKKKIVGTITGVAT